MDSLRGGGRFSSVSAMVSLARWREAFRKLFEKYGLMLSPEQANRRKEMKLQQANRRKQMKLQKANRRKELKLLNANLKKFGLSMDHYNRMLHEINWLLTKEIANCKKQGIQIPLMNLQNTVSLRVAIHCGDESFIRFLLHCGVDPNIKDSEGKVSLWEALLSDNDCVIRLLIDNGANLYSGDMGQFAWTAATNGSVKFFEAMVFYGGDITLPNINGRTVLSRTVGARQFDIVRFLLLQGAAGPPSKNWIEYIDQQELLKQKAVCKRPVSNEGTLVGKHVICPCKCSKPPLSRRVRISCLQIDNAPRLVALPQSHKELLELSTTKFGVLATKVLTEDRAEIDDISLIRDGDHLIFAGDAKWTEPSK